jgi:hypothetical protein
MYKKVSILMLITIMAMGKIAYGQQTTVYPKITGYFAMSQPLAILNNGSLTGYFGDVHAVSFPFGLNVLKSDRFGISFEVSPTIRTENNISKVSSVAFQPGAMFRYSHGFNIITRLAFETNGRFGCTPILNKVVYRGRDCNLFASVPFPLRFGNGQPWSAGTGLLLGVSF